MEYTVDNYLCQKCGMCRTSNSIHVFGRGDINSGVLVLGEALGCISGDSLIEVAYRDKSKWPKGIPIKDLVGLSNFYVYSYDIKNKKLCLGKVKKVWKTGVKPVYKVTYEWTYDHKNIKRNSIKVTSNHPFLLKSFLKRDPYKGINTGKDTYLSIDKGLSIGHSLQPFNRYTMDGYSHISVLSKFIIKECRFLLENTIGRKLKNREQCHHIDRNKLNDSKNNLQLLSISDHAALHMKEDGHLLSRPSAKENHKKALQNPEYRKKQSIILKKFLSNPKERRKRIKQIHSNRENIKRTLISKYKDPEFYYNYLLSRVNSKYFNFSHEWLEKTFKNKFPNEQFPPVRNHKIIDIQFIGEEEVYDMEVEKYNNFAVNDIFVHNSEENKVGLPFVGASGKVLQSYLDQLGINCFIGSAVKCYPTDESGSGRPPSPKEIELCKAFTIEIINKVNPRVIITIGKIAFHQLVKTGLSIESARGKKIYVPEWDATIIPTYHPAYLMRTQDKLLFKQFVEDLSLAKRVIDIASRRKMITNPRSISDSIEIKSYLEELLKAPSFAFDLETRGFNHRNDRITDISFCHTVGQGVHIQWKHIMEFEDLFRLVMASDSEKIAHNINFDSTFLQQLGFKLGGSWFDTMLAYHTLNMSAEGDSGNSLYKLETLSWFLTTEGGYKDILEPYGGIGKYQESLDVKEEQGQLWNTDEFETIEKGVSTEYDKYLLGLRNQMNTKRKEKLKNLKLTPLQYYSAMDSDVTYRLYKIMKPQIDADYKEVFYNIIMKYCYSLTQMTLNGISLDFDYMDRIARQNNSEIDKIKTKLFNKIGYEFNINSSKEVANLMYNVLKLEPNTNYVTKKSRNPSGDEEAILYFSKEKPILRNVLEYRTLAKQNSTYLVGFIDKADKLTHRIYPNYKQLTATGRTSCFLHTIPRDNKIRNMIRAEKGNKLIILDQAQVELRVLAMMANDTAMIKAFASGHDFHTYTACVMFGIPFDKFDKKKPEHEKARSSAKAINFGIVFGLQAKSLAEDLGITEMAAFEFMSKFFNTYPNVKRFIQSNELSLQQYGYVETLYGRKRYLPKVYSSNDIEKGKALRQATNTRIQSSANDITAIGVYRCQKWIEDHPDYKAKLVGTIHDSILSECPDKYAEEVSVNLMSCMTTDIPKVTMPLKVDVDIQEVWTK